MKNKVRHEHDFCPLEDTLVCTICGMEKQRTLKSILEEFDEMFQGANLETISSKKGNAVKDFIKLSIKDALETCRVEKLRHVTQTKGKLDTADQHDSLMIAEEINNIQLGVDGFNDAITQYDENCKKFMGEEDRDLKRE